MSSLSIAESRNPKSVTPKKGSAKSNATTRRKVPSTAATPRNRCGLLNQRPNESPPPRRR